MHVLILNIELDGLFPKEFEVLCNELAPTVADVPGLISKTWLENAETGTYGGTYIWESRAATEAFLESELFNVVATHPNFTNASMKDFAVIEAPTRATRGLVAVPA